jgi:Anti-sigma factor NepR
MKQAIRTQSVMKKEKDADPLKSQAIREQIDENLKRVYAATLNEELPDRFRDLLAQLQAKGEPSTGEPS